MSYDFFISYRRTDKPLVEKVVRALEARGGAVWWDAVIEGGEDWRDAIIEGLSQSETMVIFFSEACNSSKQLKKELAAADAMDKTIVPVIIEDTQPKGHFLYELASRNWINALPDPSEKTDALAERLFEEIRNDRPHADRVALGTAASVAAPMEQSAPAEPSAPKDPPPASVADVEREIDAKRVQKDLRDFLPFKWYEVLIAAVLGVLGGFSTGADGSPATAAGMDALLFGVTSLAGIATLVFPFRYFGRGRRVRRAARMYLASVGTIAVLAGIIAAFHPEFASGDGLLVDSIVNIIAFGIIFGMFSIMAFVIYGALHFQRAVKSYKTNMETI
ncbi:MAG: toll/interleukin-1 receptor domain-containing protein [Pseudomonadota bacterium]